VLLATVCALAAAVLHAAWNLIAKRSVDPFIALWGQFVVAGTLGATVLVAIGGLPAGGWAWAALSGGIHVPYAVALAWAYRHGDFSLAYPVARAGGALLATIGGLALLDDSLSALSIAAIVVIVAGMALLSVGAAPREVAAALFVAATIGVYTVVDSHAARQYESTPYVLAMFAVFGLGLSIVGVTSGRTRDLLALGADAWKRTAFAGIITVVTYGLVLLAVRHAAVGYVAALRESSVLVGALVGWRLLGEQRGRVRLGAAGVIVTGLVMLVIGG
jgi:drug/metabolite transporter (DMT)-like permease